MAQLKIRDLYQLLSQAPRRRDLEQDGIRLVYDGVAVQLSTADHPDTVIATASTCGHVTGAWDVTAYLASLDMVKAWMRMLEGDDLIDVAPFWAISSSGTVRAFDADAPTGPRAEGSPPPPGTIPPAAVRFGVHRRSTERHTRSAPSSMAS